MKKNIFDYARDCDYVPTYKPNIRVSMSNGICDICDENTGVVFQFNENKCQDWVKNSHPFEVFKQLYL